MKTKKYDILETGIKDLKLVADCQIKAFPESLSSKMGTNYLIKMFSWFLANPNAFLHHIEIGGECAGYCGGLISDNKLKMGSSSSMLQHSFGAAVKAMITRPWLLMHPEVIMKIPFIFKNIINKFKSRGKKSDEEQYIVDKNEEAKVGLVIIGVDPKYQGLGLGYLLLQNFDETCRQAGIPYAYLSVNTDNVKAIYSYERNGWKQASVNGNALHMKKKIF